MRVAIVCFAVFITAPLTALAQAPLDLMQMLKSPKVSARRLAAESLGKQKMVSAIPALVELLKDNEEIVREAASVALGQMGPKAAPALGDALKFPREDSKIAALKALLILGPAAKDTMPAIIAALKDNSVDVRIHAAAALGSLKSEAKPALPALFEAGKDTGNVTGVLRLDVPASVAEAAIAAAQEIDDKCLADLAKVALPALTAALQNKDEPAVQAAANAIAALGPQGKSALPELQKAYKYSKGFAESALSQAILAIGGDAATTLAGVANDADLAIPKRLMALSDLSTIPNPDDKVVSILMAVLKDPEPQMRAGSAMALTVIGPSAKAAIPALVDLLGDETLDEAAGKVQAGASKVIPLALTRIGSESVPALATVLKDESNKAFARWQAAGTLANLGKKSKSALPVLEAGMKDKSPLVAVESACGYVLAGGDPKSAMPVLMEGLNDKTPLALWHTADAIRRIGPTAKETVPRLTVLLANGDKEVRIAAAHALGTMGADAKPAVGTLAKLLEQKDPEQRLEIIVVLKQLGPNAKEALPALIARLNDIQPISHHPLLSTIGAFGPAARDAVPALVELLKRKEIVFHGDTMLALSRIGPDAYPAIPQLQKFLGNASEYPRARAARALGGIGPKSIAAIPTLKRLLQDDKPLVRVWAAYAMARITIDTRSNIAKLMELWKTGPDDSASVFESVQFNVAEALDLLGKEARPAKDLLLEAVQNEKVPPDTRLYAARALGHLQSDAGVIVPKCMDLLNRKVEGQGRVVNCVCAAETLGLLGPIAKSAIPRLRQLAADEEDEIAEAASRALAVIERKKA